MKRDAPADAFVDSWRVSEYVFNPDGSFAGVVRQERMLERLENGRIRVTQYCNPDEALTPHPMARFAGTWVFELQRSGNRRLYHGPDVVGMGLAWGEGAMTGRGVWPRFGHNFVSFAVLAQEDRQVTGGKFYNASQLVANVVGIAVPERASATWPKLLGPHWPGEVSTVWEGSLRRLTAAGEVMREEPVVRRYGESRGWQEEGDQPLCMRLTAKDGAFTLSGRVGSASLQGVAKGFGWLLEAEAVLGTRELLEFSEVFDAPAGRHVSLRRWYKDGVLVSLHLLRLKAKGDHA